MGVQRCQQNLRCKPRTIILAYYACREPGVKQGIESGFPVLELVCLDVGVQGPGHLNAKTNPLEPGPGSFGNVVTHLLSVFVGVKFARLAPGFSGANLKPAGAGLLWNVNSVLFETNGQLARSLVVGDVDELLVQGQATSYKRNEGGHLFSRILFVKEAEVPARFQLLDLLGQIQVHSIKHV